MNKKLPVYVSLVPDPMVWRQDALQHFWDNFHTYTFPPFALLYQVLLRAHGLIGLSLLLVALCWPDKDWFPDLLDLFVKVPVELP